MSNVICAIDTETTGLATATAVVIELALVPIELPSGWSGWSAEPAKAGRIIEDVEPFHVLIWPGYDVFAMPEAEKAMAINGISVAQLKAEGVKPEHVPAMIRGWLMANRWDRIDPLGQNWSFDAAKLERAFGFQEYSSLFSRHVRDVKRLAQSIIDLAAMYGIEVLPGTSLSALCDHFNITNPDPHRATGDAITTALVYMDLLEKLYNWHALVENRKESK